MNVAGLDFDVALVGRLRDFAPLSSLVGRAVHQGEAKRDTPLPYVLVRRIASPPDHHMAGASALRSETFQFSVYAESPEQRGAVCRALRDCLDGFQGDIGGFDVGSCDEINRLDDEMAVADGGDRVYHVAFCDYEIVHEQIVPAR